MTRATELYQQIVRAMSPSDRLRLAWLILNDLVAPQPGPDENDAWNEEDSVDLTQSSLARLEWEAAEASAEGA